MQTQRTETSEDVIRTAAVDCGTNSIRLLVADVDPATGHLTDLDRRMEIVRLGQDVDRTGRLAPEALHRTFDVCRTYAASVAQLGAERLRFVATSASRDADNRDEFVTGVRDIFGVGPEVITGGEEAQLSFLGATGELAGDDGPHLVVDIGGGSTEFVFGGHEVASSCSVDIGSVRLTERHLASDGGVQDPPDASSVAAIRRDVQDALDRAEETVPLRRARALVGLAGSVTTVAGIALDLPSYDPSRIHHSRISLARVREVTEWLLAATHAQRAALPVLHPGRVDVIGTGALVLLAVMERTGAEEVVVSEHDILDGIARRLAA